jgi:hypothetical protein
MPHRTLALAVVLAAALAGSPAGAADPSPPPGIDTVVVDRTITVTAGSSTTLTTASRPGPGRGPTIICGWFELVVEPGLVAINQLRTPTPGRTYLLWCWYEAGGASLPGHPVAAVYDPAGIPGDPVDHEEVALFALARMELEQPVATLNPPGFQIAGVPTWLAVTSRLDHPAVHANAGPVWASVRPRFERARWTFDDGAVVICTRAGDATTVWDPAGPDDQTSHCTHTFAAGSGPGPSVGRVTVTWTILRRHHLQPDWRPWRTLELTTPVDIAVVDLQAAIR